MNSTKAHVVIVGGGFAGIEVARALLRYRAQVVVTLISKNDIFEYYPGLYRVVIGAMPIEVSVALKTIFPEGVNLINGTYVSMDTEKKIVTLEDGRSINYDYVVMALGSETNYFNIPGLEERSFGFKSVEEALRLKDHFCRIFEKAIKAPKEEQVSILNTAIVGAGPSGVELAGNLKSYLEKMALDFGLDSGLITIDLIEAAPRVLPAFPPKVSEIAESRLRFMGVNIFLNRALKSEEVDGVTLGDMKLKAGTVIWTAGTKINPGFSNIPGATFDQKKRVVVTPWLTLPSDSHVFIAGDGASTLYSGLAQTAIHDGKYIAKSIHKLLSGHIAKMYEPKRPSVVIPIGTGWALFNRNDLVLKGWAIWMLRTIIDLKHFLSILPIKYVIKAIRKGKKYKKMQGTCRVEPI